MKKHRNEFLGLGLIIIIALIVIIMIQSGNGKEVFDNPIISPISIQAVPEATATVIDMSDLNPDVVWPTPVAFPVYFEATDFVLSGDMKVEVGDEGHTYLVARGTDPTTKATLTFYVTTSGYYQIKARVKSKNGSSDSFHAIVDEADRNIWHTIGDRTYGKWVDRYISRSDSFSDTEKILTPKQFYLSQGEHKLVLERRESGTQLESVLLEPQGFQMVGWPAPRELVERTGHIAITLAQTDGPYSYYFIEAENNTEFELQFGHHFFKSGDLEAAESNLIYQLGGPVSSFGILPETRLGPSESLRGLVVFTQPLTYPIRYLGTYPPVVVND